ncbi:hypothetical protein ACHQM5_005322 [Ranunculus cassubicifolius]
MPPKRRNSKKKPAINSSGNQTSTSSTPADLLFAALTNPRFNSPPPSFFYDDLPYGYSEYLQYDDFSNPFDPSHYEDSDEEESVTEPSFPFKLVEDLDEFVKKGGKRINQALMKLPLNIFLDIISRLPILPLAICRCVCKSWATVIHHPRFVKLHHSSVTRQLVNPYFNDSSNLLFHVEIFEDNGFYNHTYVMETDKRVETDQFGGRLEKGVMMVMKFTPPMMQFVKTGMSYEVVGSCNGLICLSEPLYNDPIYVCNPVIGEFFVLPSSGKKIGFEIYSGIGFDKTANEYKVVRAIFNFKEKKRGLKMEAEVYTLGSDKWRKLGKFSYPLFKRTAQVFVQGALHWLTEEYGASDLIIAFDVGNERFNVVPPYPDFKPNTPEFESCELQLGELGGKLSLFAHSFDDRCEVWIMKEYGVKSSWTKEYVISRKEFFATEVHFRPLKMMRNGNILLFVDDQSVVCYDPRRKQFYKLQEKFPKSKNFYAITHAGSFVSLRDIVDQKTSTRRLNVGEWYGIMEEVTSHKPGFDEGAWSLNEQMRQLWFENH